jgi:hypothetical protein
MPDVEKLFDMIKSDPPDNVEELKGMLANTGYGDAPEGVAGLMEEDAEVEETPEGVEVEAEAEAEDAPRSLDDILGGMMGPKGGEGDEEEGGESAAPASPMDTGKGGDVKGMSISVMRGRAAKNAMNKTKKP